MTALTMVHGWSDSLCHECRVPLSTTQSPVRSSDTLAAVDLEPHFTGDDHVEVDGIGRVGARVVGFHQRGEPGQLRLHLGLGRGQVEIGRWRRHPSVRA